MSRSGRRSEKAHPRQAGRRPPKDRGPRETVREAGRRPWSQRLTEQLREGEALHDCVGERWAIVTRADRWGKPLRVRLEVNADQDEYWLSLERQIATVLSERPRAGSLAVAVVRHLQEKIPRALEQAEAALRLHGSWDRYQCDEPTIAGYLQLQKRLYQLWRLFQLMLSEEFIGAIGQEYSRITERLMAANLDLQAGSRKGYAYNRAGAEITALFRLIELPRPATEAGALLWCMGAYALPPEARAIDPAAERNVHGGRSLCDTIEKALQKRWSDHAESTVRQAMRRQEAAERAATRASEAQPSRQEKRRARDRANELEVRLRGQIDRHAGEVLERIVSEAGTPDRSP